MVGLQRKIRFALPSCMRAGTEKLGPHERSPDRKQRVLAPQGCDDEGEDDDDVWCCFRTWGEGKGSEGRVGYRF